MSVFHAGFAENSQSMRFRTVPEMGWASFENGALLAAASGKFEVLITTDQRLSYQRVLSGLALAVVVLVAQRNKLEFLLPLVSELNKILDEVKPGEVRRVGV